MYVTSAACLAPMSGFKLKTPRITEGLKYYIIYAHLRSKKNDRLPACKIEMP